MTEPLQSPGPGWDVLDGALAALPAQAGPFRFDVRQGEGAPPLESVAALPRDGHWHYVSYGLTELYAKSSPDVAASGYGFELTVRTPRGPGEAEPPAWPAALLRAVASYVVATGELLEPGHHVDAGGPLTVAPETCLCAALVVDDPELAPVEGPFGAVRFLQLVGLSADELDLLIDWSPAGLQALLAQGNPRLVTDPARSSLLADAAVAREIAARVDREGSALDQFVAPLSVRFGDGTAELELTPAAVEPLRRVLRGRLGHARPVTIEGDDSVLELHPGDVPGWRRVGDTLVVTVPTELAAAWREELAEQQGGASRALLQDLWVRISPTGQ